MHADHRALEPHWLRRCFATTPAWLHTVCVLAGFLIVAGLSTWRLDRPLLWADEGDTVFMAGAIGHDGVPGAFDGRNIGVFGDCEQLSSTLLSKKTPWVQYYVAFLSLKIFGRTTFGARALFALLGALAFFPVGLILGGRVRFPWLSSAVLLLQPQVILFNRNARYYPLLTLEFAVLIWAVLCLSERPRLRKTVLAVVSVLLFHTHTLSAICVLVGVTAFYVLQPKRRTFSDLPWLLFGPLTWAAWYVWLPGIPGIASTFSSPIWESPEIWAKYFFTGTVATLSDLDYVGVLPLFFWMTALTGLFFISRPKFRALFDDPFTILVLCSGAALAVGTSALIGVETPRHLAVLRYMPQICVFVPALLLSCIGCLELKPGILKTGLTMTVLFASIFSFGFWARGAALSWWVPVYREIFTDVPDSLKATLDELRADNPSGNDTLVQVVPDFMAGVFPFYVGDDFRIKPTMVRSEECGRTVEQKIGPALMQSLSQEPDLVVVLTPLRFPPTDSGKWVSIPLQWHRPDAARPELTRHEFQTETSVGMGGILIRK